MPLYPATKPFYSGFLAVGDGHKIYFEETGNPKGVPVMLLHGGPGSGISSTWQRIPNPKQCRIIAFDQRGAGKSTPSGSLKANTTQHLVADIEKLRRHLKIDAMIIAGSSWGSTLALAYAQTHAKHVLGVVIGGVFLGTSSEADTWFNAPDQLARFFPNEYAALCDAVECHDGKKLAKATLAALVGKDKKKARATAMAFAMYEGIACDLEPNRAELIAALEADPHLVSHAAIEVHYLAQKCFLKPDQLMKGMDKIAHIPMAIVQGAYDMVCPPATALAVHAAHPNSHLYWVQLCGHRANAAGLKTRQQAMKDMVSWVGG